MFVCKSLLNMNIILGYIIICEIVYIDNKHVFSPNDLNQQNLMGSEYIYIK